MESSLCSVTDMSSINAVSKDNTFDTNLSDVVGGKVKPSFIPKEAGDNQELDNSPLTSVLNPGKLQHTSNHLLEVLMFVISVHVWCIEYHDLYYMPCR